MKKTAQILAQAIVGGLSICVLSGCTVKATIKTTTDVMTNFLSSTSGKSWITEDGIVQQDLKVKAFVAINFNNLKHDMAQGQGEYLASFGKLLGVPHGREQEFSNFAKIKYSVLIPSDRTRPGEMLAALSREMSALPSQGKTFSGS